MAVAGGEDATGDRRFRLHLYLALTCRATELLDAVGEDRRAGAAGADVATTRHKGVRAFDADVSRIEIVGFAPLDPVPLEGLEPVLREQREAIVGVEDVDVGGAEA